MNELERWKGAPGWVSGDPRDADLITLQGESCLALTGDKQPEQVWIVTPILCYEQGGECHSVRVKSTSLGHAPRLSL